MRVAILLRTLVGKLTLSILSASSSPPVTAIAGSRTF
jgi:hypothetical protein